jgi:thymidylate synthase
MITIGARNVNHALWAGANVLHQDGVQQDSRNGPVLRAPYPVTTVYERPDERVMLHPGRDANPFFHLYESLWMLAGRNDLAPLTAMVKNMANFSDDGGKTQPGAYGYRWRRHFQTGIIHGPSGSQGLDKDQLAWAIRRLKADPNDRRVVIQMYDANVDQDAADNGGKDIPCNLMACPTISTEGRLDLTVFCRSNDMVLGAYGANAVHFSVLAEFLAAAVGVPLGRYFQVSNNFHGYLTTMGKAGEEWPWDIIEGLAPDPYEAMLVQPVPMWDSSFNLAEWDVDLDMFMEDPARVGIRNRFLRRVACPMVMAHRAYKRDGVEAAREVLQQMDTSSDWRAGAELWLNNRAKAKEAGNGPQ